MAATRSCINDGVLNSSNPPQTLEIWGRNEDMSTYQDDRFPGPDPYAPLGEKPSFTLTSTDLENGAKLAEAQLGGTDISPQLS